MASRPTSALVASACQMSPHSALQWRHGLCLASDAGRSMERVPRYGVTKDHKAAVARLLLPDQPWQRGRAAPLPCKCTFGARPRHKVYPLPVGTCVTTIAAQPLMQVVFCSIGFDPQLHITDLLRACAPRCRVVVHVDPRHGARALMDD
jgi:hypothetical protein